MVKAWCTDLAQEIASHGVQVHGGMGFIEETGAAQHYRDARILPIYEGTNGIQAMDLVGRKLDMAGGELPWRLIAELRAELPALPGGAGARLPARSTRWSAPHGTCRPAEPTTAPPGDALSAPVRDDARRLSLWPAAPAAAERSGGSRLAGPCPLLLSTCCRPALALEAQIAAGADRSIPRLLAG